jgi:hypothetical protein
VIATRGCVAEVTPNLDENFEVTGLVMLGSRLKSITNASKKEIATLTREDVIVLWGGSNDTGKNESSKGLSHTSNFMKNRGHTNIVIMNAPHRHDLDTTSCIINDVKVFNRKLLKQIKIDDYAKVMETNLSREHFTQHGLHMNRLGKELISKTISENIKSILMRKQPYHISLKWKEDSTDPSPVENRLDITPEPTSARTGIRMSTRQRKTPVIRNEDFLW